MITTTAPPLYKRHRYPSEIISHAVWLYFRFTLSYRDVEELLATRGIHVTYETIRQWGLKFGQIYANQLKRRRPRPGDKWHLDEVFLKINGRLHHLWRAGDQDGNVLDILVTSKRDTQAAKRFFRKLLNGASGKLRGCRDRRYSERVGWAVPSPVTPNVWMLMAVPIARRSLHRRNYLVPVLEPASS